MTVTADDFADFFQAVHGVQPFPWQTRLARQVAEAGWPDTLDVPTGCGKTAAIDIAVFVLALQADLPIEQRQAPLRIAFVVDRRLVVDDAYTRACKLADALAMASGSTVLARVGQRLGRLAEEPRRPLAVARLRGGMAREPDWARTPSQPTVLVSTVDQVGSRLLFRGYGVSDSMKPIHAGLLGRDTLILLDEAHLSQPFSQTLRDLARSPWGAQLVSSPFQVVSMTATPAHATSFAIGADDRTHPVLARRLTAAKPTELVAVRATAADQAFAEAFVQQAQRLSRAGEGTAPVTAIVVNRVRRARAIFDALSRKAQADVVLLIGRTRPVDREVVLQTYLPRMRAGRDEVAASPLFVVTTQCVEAGADLDFDALVTEIAPLDCLRQRFGRLNRLGRSEDCKAVVLAASDQVSGRRDDAVYGSSCRATWQFLQQAGITDFGITAAQSWMPKEDELLPLLAPRSDAPLLLPRDVRLWSCTMPRPAVDPEVALYLHGADAASADVHIVWRAELDPDETDVWTEWVDVCPPISTEAMPMPIGEARLWLAHRASGDVADVEGGGEDAQPSGQGRRFVLWRNGEAQVLTSASGIRPGDTIIVSVSEGGADRWGWNPQSRDRVEDVADAAMRQSNTHFVLRLSDRLTPALKPALPELADLGDYEVQDNVAELLDLSEAWRRLLRRGRGKVIRRADTRAPMAVVLRTTDAASENDTSSLAAATPRRLTDHTDGVVEMTRRFLQQLGLDPEFAKDLLLAARLHDAGKAHPTFQGFLYDGDELAAIGGPVLAKSGRLLQRDAQRRAGLPVGARHEVASLHVVEAHPMFATAHDPALVLWLIGTHHGHGRPLFPPAAWPAQGEMFDADTGGQYGLVRARPALDNAELAARWLELREAVHRRYGPWCLAHLEAVLRLADHRHSELEARAT
jgi:CRISPR-associated endonuclease/helicase Cas3